MSINMAVEPLVREAFAAAVARDAGRSAAALGAISSGGDQVSQDAVELATVVCVAMVLDLYDGEMPEAQGIKDLGESFSEMEEDWSGVDANLARIFFAAITGNEERRILPPETYARVVFVIGAWLLSSFGPDTEDWWETLDRIVNQVKKPGI